MPKIQAIIDTNSAGLLVRLSDNTMGILPHGGHVPTIGEEYDVDAAGRAIAKAGGMPHLAGRLPANPPNVAMPVEYGAQGLKSPPLTEVEQNQLPWPPIPSGFVSSTDSGVESAPKDRGVFMGIMTPQGAVIALDEPRDATEAEIRADDRAHDRADQAREHRAEDKAASEV